MSDHPLVQLAKTDISLEPRLQRWERVRVNKALNALPTYHRSAEAGLEAIKAVLAEHGLSVWQSVREPVMGSLGDRYTFAVERGDGGTELINTVLLLTTYKMPETLNVECVAYLS